jgi:hypothetical protein
MPITFDERLDMLQAASRAWLELKRVIDRLSDADLTRPNPIGTWSGKDVLAHIATWEALAIEVVQAMDAGQPEQWPDMDDDRLDALNAELIEPWSRAPLADVLDYFESTHFTLMDLAERSPSITRSILLDNTADHYQQHLDDLRSLSRSQ